MIAAAYARVSTLDQGTDVQLQRIRAAAPAYGIGKLEEFVDDGVSGTLASRPELDRLRGAIENGALSAVLVTKLDRLGRSVIDTLDFFQLCERMRVRVIVVDQDFDTSTPAGRLMRTLLAAMAEFEGELVRERTRAAMSAIKSGRPTRSGRPPGRPRKVTPELEAEVRRLRFEEKLPWKQVAQRVHLPWGTCAKVRATPLEETPRLENPVTGFPKEGTDCREPNAPSRAIPASR